MLAKRIIPCLDVDKGRVVKGVKFFDHRDAGEVSECALRYEQQGADELVFYDISASHEGRALTVEILREASERVFMPLTVGGGIRTLDDIREMLNSGADKVSINTAAVLDQDLIRQAALRFGSQCIVLAVDANRVMKDNKEYWEVYINGGRRPTGIRVMDWVGKGQADGAGEIVLNVMNADGTKAGYDLEMTAAVSEAVGIPVVASGGAGAPADIEAVLTEGQADAALAASIFHFGQYTIAEVKQYLQERGINVRWERRDRKAS
ncbi:MAG: imidazole glycerol phosphate synthase subunit HisF [Phycisphaerae bacterium SM23_30]|nr:MAG: imidazole glycerol phosphate synthase subunit HisF [Phycisphaerae bacterium SM23_30]